MESANDDRRKKTQRSEMVLVGFLLLFAVGSIAFGIIRLKDSIQKPFQAVNTQEPGGSLLDGVDRGGIDIEGLKTKDTDGDGLNDYQESYITQTSQYVADSDGDGISDKEEVTRGTNPNCPEGTACFDGSPAVRLPLNPTLPSAQSGAIDPSTGQTAPGAESVQAINQVLQQFQNMTPAQIRIFLKEQGIPEDQLSKIPDPLLQALYTQGINQAIEQAKNKGISLPTPAHPSSALPSPGITKNTDFSLLTPQEIRALLEQSGKVPLDVLKNVPDSALKDIFLKAVQSAGK